jgi:hypothetical protein
MREAPGCVGSGGPEGPTTAAQQKCTYRFLNRVASAFRFEPQSVTG